MLQSVQCSNKPLFKLDNPVQAFKRCVQENTLVELIHLFILIVVNHDFPFGVNIACWVLNVVILALVEEGIIITTLWGASIVIFFVGGWWYSHYT